MKIATRLMLLIMLVAVLPLALFSYFNLKQDQVALRAEVLGKLSGLADKKAIQVGNYLAERKREVQIRALSPQVMGAMIVMPAAYTAGQHNPAYLREDALLHDYFERYVSDLGLFYDMFLITPQGEIIYTQRHEADFASNLLAGPYTTCTGVPYGTHDAGAGDFRF